MVDVGVRGFFFGMNLLFNAAMWALFTAALTRSDSTTRVSIVNVSANFMITAILGWIIFGEKLPPLWWLGASMLAVGNVVIGRREEGEKPGGTVGLDETREEAENLLAEPGGEGDLVELDESTADMRQREEQARVQKAADVDAPI
jgi:multidrug transporter EmrE-like cation transporter